MRECLTLRLWAVVAAATSIAGLVPAQWVQETPTSSPTARVAAAMDFVPMNGGIVLFGGAAPLINGETWTFDGTNWTQLAPATSPTARFGAALVMDYARGVGVLYGGLATNISVPPPTSETWEWDGATWTLRTPTANAGPRYRYGACFDGVTGKVVMYGGATSQLLIPPSNQTWEYDGTTWAQRTTTGNPGPRERPAMCFHPGLGKAVLFGGTNGSGVTDQTWLYDGVAGTWTQVAIGGVHPSARNAAQMVYDAAHGVCVLTGGQDSGGVLGDTWTFDGTKWAALTTPSPTIRDHMLAFAPTTAQVVRFGGFVAPPNTTTNETWSIGTAPYGGGCTGTNGAPTLAATSALQLGASWTLNVGNLNPVLNLAFLVLGAAPVPGVDLAFLGMPGCAVYTTPDLLLDVVGAAGSATWTWPVVAGPIGVSLYCQALCLDPAANTFGFTLSNAIYATLDG